MSEMIVEDVNSIETHINSVVNEKHDNEEDNQENENLENNTNEQNEEDTEDSHDEDDEDYESDESDESETTYDENTSTFDEFNFDSEVDEEDDTISMESDEEEDTDDEIDYDNAEFNFEDVKYSIEYIQERYNFFKKSVVQECSLYLLYMEKNTIVNVDKVMFDLQDDGYVNKDNIVELLQEKRINDDKKYFIKELWQYNFNINSETMINMFDEDEKFNEIENMMKPLNKLSDIHFDNSIDVFKDKNSLFVLYTLDKPERKTPNKRKSLKKRDKKSSTRKTHKKEKK
tara:strand:+ start:9766 stop:10626 length:861 start_codon:yes stop_codon:yes gene_type:complete